MCVIASKTVNAKFPSKDTLQICWDNNPDGAGFMYVAEKKVHIRKGFMTFDDFWSALVKVRTKYGDKIACVMHFRIGTQGGNIPANTHPFPLSRNMDNLRKLSTRCDIGVAHNGIIDLTSNYGAKVNYSDTMKFITDYLSLIIHDNKWQKSKDTCTLIERLIESRLCVLHNDSSIKLLGEGWNKDKDTGVMYSNHSWEKPKVKKYDWSKWNDYRWNDPYETYPLKPISTSEFPNWEAYFDESTGTYDFDDSCCPGSVDGDDAYCDFCANKDKCQFRKWFDYPEDDGELNK